MPGTEIQRAAMAMLGRRRQNRGRRSANYARDAILYAGDAAIYAGDAAIYRGDAAVYGGDAAAYGGGAARRAYHAFGTASMDVTLVRLQRQLSTSCLSSSSWSGPCCRSS
eukprot:1778239-Rhodomonas_salina.3